MALVPSFTVSQSATTPANVTFVNTATGSDAAVTHLRIYITDNDGTAIVPSGTSTAYIAWALATTTLTVSDLLTTDLAVNIVVQWLSVTNVVLYSSEDPFCLRQFNKQQFIYLIQNQALSPSIVQDTNYFSNLCQYWINIVGANTMIEDAEDLAASQNCLNRGTDFLNNETLYF